VLTGDFNDFEFSETAKALAGNELINLMQEHDAADRYSYFYRGSNQSLDNIFISKNLAGKAVFAPVHINASFMEEHGRASDHDPVVVQLDFSKDVAASTSDSSQPSQSTGQSSVAAEQGAPSQTNPPSSNQTGQGQTASSKKKGLPKTGQNTSGWAVLGLTLLMFAFTLKKRSRN